MVTKLYLDEDDADYCPEENGLLNTADEMGEERNINVVMSHDEVLVMVYAQCIVNDTKQKVNTT